MAKNSENPQYFGDVDPSAWPGERLGLPQTGSLSIARIGRRFGALFSDWIIATVLTAGVKASFLSSVDQNWDPTITLIIFSIMQVLLVPTIGGSIGHRVFGLRVIKLGGGWVGFFRPLVRTILLLLVIPVLVWDSDQRGFHDKIAGTALVRS